MRQIFYSAAYFPKFFLQILEREIKKCTMPKPFVDAAFDAKPDLHLFNQI
jgi:hypothetical protein